MDKEQRGTRRKRSGMANPANEVKNEASIDQPFTDQLPINMEGGWLRLYRKSINSQVFQNEGLWKVWTWCLMKANYKDAWVSIQTGRGKTEVLVKRGQFIFGRKSAAKELGMKLSTVHDRMEKLVKARNIDIQSNTHYSIIIVCNYCTYQEDGETKCDTQPDNQPTSNQQPTNTNKNKKKEKNDQEILSKEGTPSFEKPDRRGYGKFSNVMLYEPDLQNLYAEFSKQEVTDAIESMSSWLQAKGRTYEDYRAALWNWIAKDRKNQTPKKGKVNVYREYGKQYPTGDVVKITNK